MITPSTHRPWHVWVLRDGLHRLEALRSRGHSLPSHAQVRGGYHVSPSMPCRCSGAGSKLVVARLLEVARWASAHIASLGLGHADKPHAPHVVLDDTVPTARGAALSDVHSHAALSQSILCTFLCQHHLSTLAGDSSPLVPPCHRYALLLARILCPHWIRWTLVSHATCKNIVVSSVSI